MVSRNNEAMKRRLLSQRQVPHYSLRKLGIGVVSVLLGATMYLGGNSSIAKADTNNIDNSDNTVSNSAVANAQEKLSSNQVTLSTSSSVTSTSAGVSSTVQSQNSQVTSNTSFVQGAQPVAAQGSNIDNQKNITTDKPVATSSTNQVNAADAVNVSTESLANQASTEPLDNKAESSTSISVANNAIQNSLSKPVIINKTTLSSATSNDNQNELGQLNFYNCYSASNNDNNIKLNADGAVFTIPFQEDNGHLNVIDLNNYKEQIFKLLDPYDASINDMVFRDNSNHIIDTFNPNVLANKDSKVSIYITRDSDYGFDNNFNKMQSNLDQASYSQNGSDKTVPFDSR